jgi:acetamidase/formamidase
MDRWLGREHVVYRFAQGARPALEADPGDRITFETLDSWSGRLKRPEDIGRVPMDPPSRTRPPAPCTSAAPSRATR